VTLDAGDLLARVVALFFCRVGVLHALRINDNEAGRGVAPQFVRASPTDFFKAAQRSLRAARRTPFGEYAYTVTQLETLRKHAPLAAALEQIQHGVEDLMQIHRARLVRLRTDSSTGRIRSNCSGDVA